MLSLLERIKERQKLLEGQPEGGRDRCIAGHIPSGGQDDIQRPTQLNEKNASHHRKEQKSEEKSSKRPPKVIYLNDPKTEVSPLRLSKSMFKQSRKTRSDRSQRNKQPSREHHHGSPKKRKQRTKTEDAAAVDRETDQKESSSCCSNSISPNDSVLNESWDLTSFLSGEVSFTQRVLPLYDGNHSFSSKGHETPSRRGSVATSRRGSVATGRRGSVATSRRSSVCSNQDENDLSSVSSSVLDELEVRSKGTIKNRPSYSEIKGNVTSDASKSLIRRYSIDNSNLRPGHQVAGVDVPSCLQICEAKMNAPSRSKDQGFGVCYGIIDKYMANATDTDASVRRSQSYSEENQSRRDEEESVSTSSSLLSGESSKRVSMAPSDLMQQLQNSYRKPLNKKSSQKHSNREKKGCGAPKRSKSDSSDLKSKTREDANSAYSYHSPERTNSDGYKPFKGSLPLLSPELASPRKPLSNAEILKKAPDRKSRTNESKTSRDESRSKASRRHSNARSRGIRSAETNLANAKETDQAQPRASPRQHQPSLEETYSEECVDYVPPSLRTNQACSRRQSTGQSVSGVAARYPSSQYRRQSTGQSQGLYPTKNDDVRSYLERELKVANPSGTKQKENDNENPESSIDNNAVGKPKKKRKPRVSEAA